MTTERVRCGTVRSQDSGRSIVVYGWVDRRRDHGGLTFLDIRDVSGTVQAVINPENAPEAHAAVSDVRLEWVLKVEGTVALRSAENINPKKATGEVEIVVERCSVLSESKTPPFPVNDDSDVDEKLRLRYRYLDLRRPRLQHNLRQRARFIAGVRRAMDDLGFFEIETPTMIRATPEGARDYLVPSRIFPGSFYALPQSPQLYKQLSMVAGLDRYYQIARCYRDEDLRADRQPEFTQLDIEMSFVDEEDIFVTLEQALSSAWTFADFHGSLPAPFPRMTWHEAMRRYGVDKPDIRFPMELCDLSEVVRSSGFRVFKDAVEKGGVVKAIVVAGGQDMSRSDIENGLHEIAKSNGAKGLAYLWRMASEWRGGIAKFFSDNELEQIAVATDARVGDLILFVADTESVAAATLGALRNHLGAERSLYDPNQLAMLWVTEFPMFEQDDDGVVSPLHHPFTMVHADDVALLETEPLKIRSRAYDIVLNGREIGSGSIRITDPQIQRRVFAALGIDADDAQRKFGFLLDAFGYGAPPHGGFAAGIDRLVMEGLRESNIRDVIAYPKNQQAQELMTNAPATVDEAQLKELGIRTIPPAS